MKKLIRILPIIVGSMLLLYPWIGNWIYDHAVRSQAAGYEKALMEESDTELQNCLLTAQNYNEELKKLQNVMIYPPQEQSLNHEAYEAVLCMNAEGLMGFIEIPQIHVYLPIYHGTSEHVLQLGAGHLEGSSLPVGGSGTKAVISAHTGMNTAPMFSDLSELQPGDEFCLHVLNRRLVYEVCDIEVVLPEETQILAAEPDRDLVTLLTCTPYGQNTHRLLVTGQRIAEDAQTDTDHAANRRQRTGWKSQWMSSYVKAVCLSVGLLAGLYSVYKLIHMIRRRRRVIGRKQQDPRNERSV